jgi:hypothetical protein
MCLLLAAVTAVTYARVGLHQLINYDDNCYVTVEACGNLGIALMRQGKPQEPQPHARKARDLAQAAGKSALVAKAQTLLDQCR